MTQSAFVGPLVSLGGISSGPKGSPPTEYSVQIGPSSFWAGAATLARTGGGSKDRGGMGQIPSLFMSDNILSLNQVIQPGGVGLTTAANATSGTPFPLVTASALGISPQAPSALAAMRSASPSRAALRSAAPLRPAQRSRSPRTT